MQPNSVMRIKAFARDQCDKIRLIPDNHSAHTSKVLECMLSVRNKAVHIVWDSKKVTIDERSAFQ